MTYDIKKQLDARAGNAKTSGTALQGKWELVSDCESLTSQAGTLGVWSAVGSPTSVTLNTSVEKQGSGCIDVDLASTSLNTGCKFTLDTSANWQAYNYLGFWIESTATTSAGNITVSLDDSYGNEVLASQDVQALLVADYWIYVPIPLAACTSKLDIKVIKIICEDEIGTTDYFIDNVEVFEFRAGWGPLKEGIVKKVRVGTTGFAVGDAVELEAVQQSTTLGTGNDPNIQGVAITAGTANSTQQGTEVAWILVEGACILQVNEGLTAGDGMALAVATTLIQEFDDGGGDTPLQYGFYALEDATARYETIMCYCQGQFRRPSAGA